VQRHNHGISTLSGGDHSRLELPPRTSGTIRREGDGSAGLKLPNRAKECASPASSAGAREGVIPERVGKLRQVSPFASFTDHYGDSLVAVLPE
jgi:hypothetical protein